MNYQGAGIEAGEPLLIEDGSGAVRRRRRTVIIAAVVALAIAALALWYFTRDKGPPAAPPADTTPNVTVVVPARHPVGRSISATGSLAARREMPVGVAGEGGLVTRVLVEPGQWVRAGQVLATVDRSVQQQTAATMQAQVGIARADLDIAQQELERSQTLVGRGFISKADLQRKEATRNAAVAKLRAAQAGLGETRARNARLDIRAPAAGLVLTRQVEPGQIVSSGAGVLFRMAMGGQMELRAQLAESDLVSLRPGARATVTPVGETRSFPGEVWQVSPVIDPQTRQGIARVSLRYDPALRVGGFASASITGGISDQSTLPQSAIMSDDQGNYVYVVGKDNKVQRRNVRLGTVTDTDVAIADGLTGTERVVLSAGAFLNPGQKIKPALKRS